MAKKRLKIFTPNTSLKINELISLASGRKKEILFNLKKLNADACKLMTMPANRYSNKYTILQQTKEWKQAKKFLLEFFDNDLVCKVCQKKINDHDCVMHHSVYKLQELFTPLNIEFLHDKCHESISIKNKKEKNRERVGTRLEPFEEATEFRRLETGDQIMVKNILKIELITEG